MPARVLIIESDAALRSALLEALDQLGHEASACPHYDCAEIQLDPGGPIDVDAVVIGNVAGDVVALARRAAPRPFVVLLTGPGDAHDARADHHARRPDANDVSALSQELSRRVEDFRRARGGALGPN